MALDSLGYFGVRTRNLDDWSSFGQKFLGLQLVDRSRKSLTFRMDDRRQRIVGGIVEAGKQREPDHPRDVLVGGIGDGAAHE